MSSGEMTAGAMNTGAMTAGAMTAGTMNAGAVHSEVSSPRAGWSAKAADGRGRRFGQFLDEMGITSNSPRAWALGRRYREIVEEGRLDLWGPIAHAPTLTRFAEDLLATGRQQVEALEAFEIDRHRLLAALCPHGPLDATGLASARAYASLSERAWPEVFIILATSHYVARPGLLTASPSTALGSIDTDPGLIDALLAGGAAEYEVDDPVFLLEHSWKQDLPLLQVLAKRFDRPLRVVPILAGGLSFDEGVALGQEIAEILYGRRSFGCLLVSGDLSHFGHGYSWRPRWLEQWLSETRSVSEVIERVGAFERPLIEAITHLDQEALRELLPSTGFCARGHLGALCGFAASKGISLGAETVLNDRRVDGAISRSWQPQEDRLFRGGSAVFLRPMSQSGDSALCSQIVTAHRGGEIALAHRCTDEEISLPLQASGLLNSMWQGAANRRHLESGGVAAAAGFEAESVLELIRSLDAGQWLHEPTNSGPPAQNGPRLASVLADCRERIPHYRESLPCNRLDQAPFLEAATIRRGGRRFLPADAPENFPSREYFSRRSSGSTSGQGLLTVEHLRVVARRNMAVGLVGERDHRGMLSLNRPSNLELSRSDSDEPWPRGRIDPENHSRLSPGPDPTRVEDEVWDRVIHTILESRPRVLEGDPTYLHGLALRCRALDIRFPSVRHLELGHSYAWSLYRWTLADVFKLPIRTRLLTSEVGDITATCPLGREHLLESHIHYEIRRRGRSVRPGGFGALVLTTLDPALRPLVRYVNGDLIRLVEQRCPCGRPFRVVEYEGRLCQLFAGPGGRPVSMRSLDEAFGAPAGVRFFRFRVQEKSVDLDLVPTGSRELVDVERIQRRIRRVAGKDVVIHWRRDLEQRVPGEKPNALWVLGRSIDWAPYFLFGAAAGAK